MYEKKNKIKISAPRENPHICYIPEDRREAIAKIKEKTGMSLYRVLCTVSHRELRDKDTIHKFKSEVRKKGFKDIGEWATALVDLLYESIANLEQIDLTSIELTKEAK